MANNNKNANEEHMNDIIPSEKREQKTIFSQEEVRSTIKGFTLAWLRGQVIIDFTTADDFVLFAKREGKTLSYEEATNKEVKHKTEFIDKILICAGSKPATPKQQEETMSQLFELILIFRAGDRIKGNFFTTDIEERLSKLEEGLTRTNNLIEEMVHWIRSGMS